MADLSILEFIIYAVIGYSPIILLMGYILVDKPGSTSNSIMRIVYVLPGMAGLILLISVGGFTVTDHAEEITISTISDYEVLDTLDNPVTLNSTTTETKTSINYLTLQNPLWITFNGMLFLLYTLYIIINILELIGLDEKFKR